MRAGTLLAIAAAVLIAAYFIARGPRPESKAQVAARQAADSLTRARLGAFERGDFHAWARALRPDALVIAADSGEVLVGREAAEAEMKEYFGLALGHESVLEFRPRIVVTGATRRGRLAWAAAELE